MALSIHPSSFAGARPRPVADAIAPHLTVPPLEPIDQLLERLVGIGLHAAFGVALGSLAARLIRARRLRWTWSLVPLLVVQPVGWQVAAPWSTTLGVAALYAALQGRSRHREDLALGGDLAEAARACPGPVSFAHLAAVQAGARILARWRPAGLTHGRLEIGRSERARAVSVPFGAHGGRHALVVGATGSGKTVTQTWVACRAIEAGLAAVVIDPKGDRAMREALIDTAAAVGRPFVAWTPVGPTVYNPFGRGSASEIADKALAGERFTEPHYQRQAQRYLGHVVRMLRGAGVPVSLSTLVEHLDPEALERLSETVAGEQADRTREYLASQTARQRSDLAGVRDRLAIVAESDVSRWLDPATPAALSFDLFGAIVERAIVYLSLQADSWPLLAQMLGTAIVGDLRTTMAALQRAPIATVVVIDEFAALASEQVAHLFGRARSAGINLVLGTQELSDLRVDGRGQLREQVLGNLSCLIAHRQVVGESAELVSGLSGTVGCWRTSRSSDGRWSQARTRVAAISAERVRALPCGVAAVIDLAGGQAPTLARIHARR